MYVYCKGKRVGREGGRGRGRGRKRVVGERERERERERHTAHLEHRETECFVCTDNTPALARGLMISQSPIVQMACTSSHQVCPFYWEKITSHCLQ